jgi:competence protein ComEC
MALRSFAFPLGSLLLAAALVVSVSFGSPALWQGIAISLLLGGLAGVLTSLALRRFPLVALLLVLPVAVGLWRGAQAADQAARPWTALTREPVQLLVEVDAEAEPRGTSTFVFGKVTDVLRPAGLTPPGRVRLVLPPLTTHSIGARLHVEGRFEPVDEATSWGQRLLRQGVVATANYPIVIPDPQAAPPSPFALSRVRAALDQAARLALPEPHASLLAGLVVGSEGGTSEEFRQALVASGTTHIVVVSGYNVSIVASALSRLRWAHWTSRIVPLVGIFLFAMLAGGSPPALRAALMGAVGLLALTTGRGRDALLALGLAVSAMLLVDPRLALDLGFQLSALATLGLIALQPRVAALFPRVTEALREPLASTIAAQLATMPVLVSTFHLVSVVSPLSNLLVAPLIPVATIMGAFLLPVVAAAPLVAGIAAALVAIPTAAIVGIVELTAQAPAATWAVGDVPPALVGVYVAALGVWAIGPTPEGSRLLTWLTTGPRAQPLTAGVASIVALGAIAWTGASSSEPMLTVTVLDVGEGDAVFVRAPNGRTVLIDGGPDPALLLDRLGRRLGILERQLSGLVLTGSDPERLPGSAAAAERYPPSVVVDSPETSTLALHERWRTATRRAQHAATDSALEVELAPNITLEVVPSPPIGGAGPGGRTQRSLLVRIVHGEVTILVAPSLDPEAAVAAYRAGRSLTATALVVPRHGDASGLDETTLQRIQPSVAIIPVGARNRTGHPSDQILGLLSGIPTYRTDLHGSVELRSDGHQIWVSPERGGL